MFDAQNAINNSERMADEEDEGIYTGLDTLLTAPINSIVNKTFWIKT